VGNVLYNVGQKTGGCDSRNGVTGIAELCPDNVTPGVNGYVSVNYRGIEDLWGNVFEFVDGINIKNAEKQPYIADSGFVTNRFDGNYTASGLILPDGDGYIKNIGCSASADWLLLPVETGGAYNTYITDHFLQNWGDTSDKVAIFGGHWNHGVAAGLFCWYVDKISSSGYIYVGTRVLLIP
jgi:hypothetical protein